VDEVAFKVSHNLEVLKYWQQFFKRSRFR